MLEIRKFSLIHTISNMQIVIPAIHCLFPNNLNLKKNHVIKIDSISTNELLIMAFDLSFNTIIKLIISTIKPSHIPYTNG